MLRRLIASYGESPIYPLIYIQPVKKTLRREEWAVFTLYCGRLCRSSVNLTIVGWGIKRVLLCLRRAADVRRRSELLLLGVKICASSIQIHLGPTTSSFLLKCSQKPTFPFPKILIYPSAAGIWP
jgi:hypothetical protein